MRINFIYNYKFVIICTSLIILTNIAVSQVKSDSLYVGQAPPGDKPEIFAPGIISLSNRFESYPTFSPDGKEMFFTVVNAAWTKGTIFHTQEQNGNWTIPDTAFFSKNNYINWESSISPDGKRQFFASNRPPSSNMDIWMIEHVSDTTWSDPVHLSGSVNSGAEDGSACVTNDGTLYFKSLRGGGINGSWLYRAKLIDSTYSQVENLGGIIKTGSGETEPFMAPDESYLIFISETRTGGYGGWDLWICFRNRDSSWTLPVNMGPDINTSDDEYGPRVTDDGKYLFFTRENRGKTMDIYWVNANYIDSLKQKVTGVESEKRVVLKGFHLFQNFPNPFNPSTVIGYQLLVNSYVKLKVYNVLGREVATLVNEQKPAGVYQVTFDARMLPSGVYFYRLQAGSYLETRKLVALK